MDAPAPTHRSQTLDHSSMFHFLHRLVGTKSGSKRSDKGLAGDEACPSQEQDADPLMMGHKGQVERKELGPPSMLAGALEVAIPEGSPHLPVHNPSHQKMGDAWVQTLNPTEILQVTAQGKEVESVLPRGSKGVLSNLSEKEKEEEEEEKKEATRDQVAQSQEVKQEHWQRAVGPREVSSKTYTRKQEKESLLNGFVESELKKLLAVQRESRLWKMGDKGGRKLLTQPEVTLEEAGIVDGQHLLLEEMDEMGNWPPE
ncbi:gametogenetin-binding protein 1-like [Orycteropus afer afer]|uniref:Gametogenetin-binding protein 1 n=1 Tax=Orycteropus afer afer TaxID=1230840 RepID=A0A8B6ZPJ3_ORYAF|nr:gametogenetin-binding protein 1-like [Orycteropus afer afer]